MAKLVVCLGLTAVLCCGVVSGVSLALEHSLDGKTFTPGGHIVFEDHVLAGQGGQGVLIRSGAAPGGDLGASRFYSVRVPVGKDASGAILLASLPSACWAAQGFATPLTLSLHSDGQPAGLSIDLACSDGAPDATGLRLGTPALASLPSEQIVQVQFPIKAAEVKQQAPPQTPEQKKAEAAAAAAAVDQDEELTPAARAALKRKLEDENKTWLQKNWMMLIPAALMMLNRMGNTGGTPAPTGQRGGNAPAR
ncbi:hypothetical protein ACKKBF_B15885 [Auxenochlorella protothecoides x Auxenochlorella symbiontica]